MRRRGLALIKGETRIHLRPQAAGLLFYLIQQRNAPVSRADIERHLWSDDPPVDIDAGQQINTCVRLIRRALNDHAKAPTYIATCENGYHFIAPVSLLADEDGEPQGGKLSSGPPEVARPSGAKQRNFLLAVGACGAAFGLLLAFGMAALNGSYGIAAVLCCLAYVLAVVVYARSTDSVYTRGMLAALVLTVMAYIPSAATLAPVMESVINGTTLKPAVLYPFVTGLKFIPLFFVVLLEWVLLAPDANGFGRPYGKPRLMFPLLAAVVFIVSAIALVWNSGEDRIWRNQLPEWSEIALGYAVVLTANLGVWVFGHRTLANQDSVARRSLMIGCIVAYLPVGLAGFIVDQQYNVINLHYLDKRRPEAYRAANPGAIVEYRHVSNRLKTEIGPDLKSVLNDPAFERALRTEVFYKQDFDEVFQFGPRSVMFGFKLKNGSRGSPRFMIIRFPEEIATAFRFERVL